MSIVIRAFTPHHAGSVIDLILPIQQQEFGVAITAADQPDLTDIPTFYQVDRGGFWVALDGERVVGTIGLKDIGSNQAALRKMFVASDYRGRPHNTAAKLLEHLLHEAREAGVKRVWLGTTAQFLAAHRFYEKHGFTLVNESDLPERFPRMAVDTRFYCLSLDA